MALAARPVVALAARPVVALAALLEVPAALGLARFSAPESWKRPMPTKTAASRPTRPRKAPSDSSARVLAVVLADILD